MPEARPPNHTADTSTAARPALTISPARAHEAALYAETAARLIELHDGCSHNGSPTGRTPLVWLLRAAKMGAESPPALWLYLRLQSGDTSDLSSTYEELAAKTFRARQNVEKELTRTCELLKLHYPELARVVNELRHRFRLPRGKDAPGHMAGNNQGTPQGVEA